MERLYHMERHWLANQMVIQLETTLTDNTDAGAMPSWHDTTANYQAGPRQANLVLIAYASSEGSGEPAHPRSLARTSAARSYKH